MNVLLPSSKNLSNNKLSSSTTIENADNTTISNETDEKKL